MWDVRACRSCLTVKGKLEKIGDASKRQYCAVTGLQIAEGDGYPVYFCVECRHHIRKSLAFRRKSRRAHFVLKEIMAVRKEISYSDIATVNRKKTNLESFLDFWEPKHNSCFVIANEEGPEEDSLKKYDLNETSTNLHSKHIVEIAPENEPIDDEETFNEDIPTNDHIEPDDTANVDLNDVFKDLNEDSKSDDDKSDDGAADDTANIDLNDDFKDLTEENRSDDDTEFLPPDNPTKKRKRKPVDFFKHYRLRTTLDSLLLFDLTALDSEKQKETFASRLVSAPFSKAWYKCAMCLTIHNTMEDLVQHVNDHNRRMYEIVCEVCKNKFPTEEELTAHMASCHWYQYKCRICHAVCFSQKDAVSHARLLHGQEEAAGRSDVIERKETIKRALTDFTITALSQRMMSKVMLFKSRPEHKEVKKSRKCRSVPDGQYKCDVCGLRFKIRQTLENHMVQNHLYMYTCNICKEVFTTRNQALIHHEESHTDINCNECGKKFKTRWRLQIHRLAHIQKFPCNLCGRSLRGEKSYYKHQMSEHGYISINDPLLGDPQYKCGTESCGVQFASKRSLEAHLVNMNHAGAENVQYACIPCNKLYDNEEDLVTHFVTCREANKCQRKCFYCTKIFYRPLDYKLHYIKVHSTQQHRHSSTICDICGKSIFTPLLDSHMKTHEGSAFECRHCSIVTSGPALHICHVLANHVRCPYKCALCTSRFRFRSDCKDHILRVHEPAKLFKCEFCAAEFSYFRNLKEHAKKLHNLDVQPIKSKITLRSKTSIYVYPLMKIIINEREREIVEQVKIELMDYLEQKSKLVDYNDYFIFSPYAEEESLAMKPIVKRRKRKKQTEVEAAVAQISLEWPVPEVKDEMIENRDEQMEVMEQMDVDKVGMENVGTEHMKMEHVGMERVGTEHMKMEHVGMERVGTEHMKMEHVGMERVGTEHVKMEHVGTEQVEMEQIETEQVGTEQIETEQVGNLEIGEKPLEVVESDGKQYVMINGEMYRIATEDDE